MNYIKKIKTDNKRKLYNYIRTKLTGLICNEPNTIANLANASALLYLLLDDINWVGFYLYQNEELVLGPFQGKPACTHIKIGKGVCGTAVQTKKIQVVEDVHSFEGHIACDQDSRSEIVVPIINNEVVVGVLDIDSPIKNRFDSEDAEGLQQFVDILNRYVNWSSLIR